MTTQFESILEIFKHPKVKLVNKAFKKQSQLFESENEIDVQFNGYNSLYEYQEYIYKCFLNFKIAIEKQMAEEKSQPSLLIQKLDLLKFEFKTFRRRYFQHNNDELMLSRIEILKNSLPVKSNDPFVKKTLQYFSVEYNFLEEIERLIKHRICHLEQFYSLKPKDKTESTLPNSKELSAYLSGQLSLFPKDSGHTNLQWNRSKVDFIELSIALFESNSIKSSTEHKISKKELFKILMWFFNVPIARWESSLTAAKNRKVERDSPFLKELTMTFSEYAQQNLK